MQIHKPETIIKRGGIGVFPTDTLYGVVANAFSKSAIKRIYTLKGRDEHKPFIVLISSLRELAQFSVRLTNEQKKFIEQVWPGPVSIIFPVVAKKFEYLHRGTKSIAFRMPKNKKVLDFIQKTGPLVAPSANPQGKKPAATVSEARNYFGESVDFYVAGGRKEGAPSTVVSFLGSDIRILREGVKKIKKPL